MLQSKPLPPDYFDSFLKSPVDIERSRILKEQLIARIKEHGPLTFPEFMHESLYGNYGFYSARKGGIEQGTHFLAETTSPEIHSLFARALALSIIRISDEMNLDHGIDVVEMGAGTGALARDILTNISRQRRDVYEKLRYTIVDLSPSLQEEQRANIKDDNVTWIYASAIDLPIRNLEGIFISNELVDSFPFHRLIVEKGHLKEIFVGEEDGKLVDLVGKPSEDFKSYFRTSNFKPEEGIEIHVSLEVMKFMQAISKALKRGYVISVDYGDTADAVHKGNSPWNESSVSGVHYSLEGSDEKAIYDRVGGVDITTNVDFTQLLKGGERWGLSGLLLTQTDFLKRAGVDGSFSSNALIGDAGTTLTPGQVSELFNTRHKVLIQEKRAAAR